MKHLVLLLLFCLVGCSIYKSDDRDTFNQNALAGAPKQLLLAIASDVDAETCWLASINDSRVLVDESRGVATVHERNLVCLFTFAKYSTDSRAQVASYSTRLRAI